VQGKATCSPVAFNDIKHLNRSMPADGLEAQDVAPRRQRPDSAAVFASIFACAGLPNEMPCLPASTRVGSTRKTGLGMGHRIASEYPALRPPISREMEC